MSRHLSRHHSLDDSRYWRFERTCPGFHVERPDPDRPVWVAVCLVLVGIAVYLVLSNIGVINP